MDLPDPDPDSTGGPSAGTVHDHCWPAVHDHHPDHGAAHHDHLHHHHSRPATRTTIAVTLTQPATLTVTLEKGSPGRRRGSSCVALGRGRRVTCTRYRALAGQRVLHLPAGTSSFRLGTLWAGRTLASADYRLALDVLDAQGNRVGPVTARFSVRP